MVQSPSHPCYRHRLLKVEKLNLYQEARKFEFFRDVRIYLPLARLKLGCPLTHPTVPTRRRARDTGSAPRVFLSRRACVKPTKELEEGEILIHGKLDCNLR